jgi:hypothetical protein
MSSEITVVLVVTVTATMTSTGPIGQISSETSRPSA